MQRLMLGAIAFLLLSSCTPSVNVIYHSEEMASDRALEFIETAFIKRDYKLAYSTASETFKNNIPIDKFSDSIAKIHPAGFPKTVKATDFEPIPGQKAMYIFIYGENENEKFYYQLTMEGTKETNYKVLALRRSDEPFPFNKLRQPLKK